MCKLLIKKIKGIDLSISYTSRNKRLNEINGKDYFLCLKKFETLKNKNYFIDLQKILIIIMDHLWEMLLNQKKKQSSIVWHWLKVQENWKNFKNDIIDIFILPPSKLELKRRLIKRGRDNNNEIKKDALCYWRNEAL